MFAMYYLVSNFSWRILMSTVMNPTIVFWLALASIAATTTQADTLDEELLACRDLSSAVARLDCYDAAMDGQEQAGSSQPAAVATEPAAEPAAAAGPATTAEPAAVEPATTAAPAAAASAAGAATISQEELFGQNTNEVQRTVEEATGSERIDSINAQVTRLQKYDYEKAVISLDNEQVWKQVDGSSLRLRVGDDVIIERAAFGSFMLKKVGSKRTMRVSRVD